MKWLYEAMVKPVVLYGALVWAHKIPTNHKPLARLQRLAMLCLGFFLRSTPMLGLQIALNYMPLDILAKEEAAKAAIRIKGRNSQLWDGIGNGDLRGHLFHY